MRSAPQGRPAPRCWNGLTSSSGCGASACRGGARDEAQEGFNEDACARIAGKLVAAVEERESPPVCFELAPANDLPLADDPPEDRDFAPDHDKT